MIPIKKHRLPPKSPPETEVVSLRSDLFKEKRNMTLFGQVPGTDFEEMETTPVFTKTLAEMAVTPASELMVREAHRSCWPKLWIRKMRLWIAFASGAILVINLTAVYIIHATLQNLDSRTEEIVARTVEKLLQEQRISLPRKIPAQMSGGTGYNQGDVP